MTNFLGTSANTALVIVQGVVLVPLYLHWVGPRLYGAWLASGDFLIWMQAFDLGLPNLLVQKAGNALGSGDEETAGCWFGTGVWVLGGVSCLVIVSGVVAAPFVPALFHLEGRQAAVLSACFALGSLAAGIALFSNIFIGYSRAIQDTAFLNGASVAASFLGFATSLGALIAGRGLWAIPFGLLARAVTVLGASLWYVNARVPRALRGRLRPDRRYFREYFTSLPATATGGIAYAIMNQSETALIGAVTRPELAVVYNLTKKAVDVARSVTDMVAFSAYGGFAHLVASGSGVQIRKVYFEVRSIRLVAAFGAAAAYVAVNRALVGRWVGSAMFGGDLLTFLLAVQFLAAGDSFLVNYLYRAAGHVERGSWLLGAEAALRVLLMVVGLKTFGVAGVPLATVLVCLPFTLVLERSVLVRYPKPGPGATRSGTLVTYLLGGALVGGSALIVTRLVVPTWPGIIACGGLMFLAGSILLLITSSPLSAWRASALVHLVKSRWWPYTQR